MSSFIDAAQQELENAGLGEIELVSAAPELRAFGDTTAVFRVGPLLLRLTRERGQTFVELAAQSDSGVFHQFDDVDIAMGWRSVGEVLEKDGPEPVSAVLQRIRKNLPALRTAFSGEQARFTRARVEQAAKARGQAFTARLRSPPKA